MSLISSWDGKKSLNAVFNLILFNKFSLIYTNFRTKFHSQNISFLFHYFLVSAAATFTYLNAKYWLTDQSVIWCIFHILWKNIKSTTFPNTHKVDKTTVVGMHCSSTSRKNKGVSNYSTSVRYQTKAIAAHKWPTLVCYQRKKYKHFIN